MIISRLQKLSTFTKILMIFLFISSSFLINTNEAHAQVDCEEMVSDCIDGNPYNAFVTPGYYVGYNQGCESAGSFCLAQQE